MDIITFRRVLTAFADEPSDVDIRLGKVVAQIRDDVIDATISFEAGDEQQLRVTENGQQYSARTWLVNRVARLPQLADRIIASTSVPQEQASRSPFVVPSGVLTPDLSEKDADAADSTVADAVATLLAKASNAVPGATSVLYLTSDAGEGKTTVINRAARLQAERYKQKAASCLIVPVPLSGRAFLTFDDAVIAALVNKFRFNYLYFDAFIQLVRMGVVVPAFDGYEEMLVEGSKGEAISALGNLVQTLESAGTIVIAARKAFFDYLSFKTQARLLDAIGDHSASFSRLALSRWSRAQFCEYGQLRKAKDPEEVYDAVAARLGASHPLLTRAVLVRRLFDVIDDGTNTEKLTELLGSNPHDYFFTFVDAIVKREASEKWLSRISGDVMVPLLDTAEHHLLLAQIAQEMWQTSTSSLRHDVLDVIVEIFGESLKKGPAFIRQIKERVKQHSLLIADASRGGAMAFDHEDFQNFYLGESLGQLLVKTSRSDLQGFLSVNLVPPATIEQAVQFVIRHKFDAATALQCVLLINETESGFTFCKENCGTLAMRLAECIQEPATSTELSRMTFPPGSLAGRNLSRISFVSCQFQPTGTSMGKLSDVEFRECSFERLECDEGTVLSTCSFVDCRVDSLVVFPEGEQTFDPSLIAQGLMKAGAKVGGKELPALIADRLVDERVRLLERLLRIFLRSTQVDEEVVRLRLGKTFAPTFFDVVLPELLAANVIQEVPWRGGGIQRRYKLVSSMSTIEEALELCRGDFDEFVRQVRSH